MTRRFKPADFSFRAPSVSAVDEDPLTALDGQRR